MDGAGGILVVVKFANAVGIIGEAQDNDNTTVAELTGGGVNEGEPRFTVSLDAGEAVSGIPIGGGDINSLLETWSSLFLIPTGSAIMGSIPFITAATKLSPFLWNLVFQYSAKRVSAITVFPIGPSQTIFR